MTLRRLLTLIGVAVGLTVFAGGSVIVRLLVWPRDPDASLQLVDGRRVGEAIGYIVKIEAERRTLQVSESLFGFRPLSLVVGDDATILIHDKEGGLGDLVADMPVHVMYERADGMRRAMSIEVLVSVGGHAPRITSRPTPLPAATLPGATPPGASDVRGRRPAAGDVVPVVSSPTVAAPRLGTRRPSTGRHSRAAAASIDPTRRVPVADPPSPRATEEDGRDGSAAIDWLLDKTGRR